MCFPQMKWLLRWERGKHDNLEGTIVGLTDDPEAMVRQYALASEADSKQIARWLVDSIKNDADDDTFDRSKDVDWAMLEQ